MKTLLFFAIIFSINSSVFGVYKNIAINGNFSDWTNVPAFYADPTNDVTQPMFDCREIKVANDASSIFLYYETVGAIDFATLGWGYRTFIDSDANPATGFNGGWMSNGYDCLIESASLYSFSGSTQSEWSWSTLASGSYGLDSNRVEIGVSKSTFGNKIVLFSQMGTGTVDDIPDVETSVKAYIMGDAPPPPSYFADINTDGLTSDWAGISPILVDPTADHEIDWAGTTTNNPPYDITDIYMANNESNLFVRIDFLGDVDVPPSEYTLFIDSDTNTATGLTYGWWTCGADFRSFYVDWVWLMSPTGVVQEFMGTNNANWAWGWEGVENSNAFNGVICIASNNVIELEIPRNYINVSNDFDLISSIFNAKDAVNYPNSNGDAAPAWNGSPNYYMFAPIPEPLGFWILDFGFIIFYFFSFRKISK